MLHSPYTYTFTAPLHCSPALKTPLLTFIRITSSRSLCMGYSLLTTHMVSLSLRLSKHSCLPLYSLLLHVFLLSSLRMTYSLPSTHMISLSLRLSEDSYLPLYSLLLEVYLVSSVRMTYSLFPIRMMALFLRLLKHSYLPRYSLLLHVFLLSSLNTTVCSLLPYSYDPTLCSPQIIVIHLYIPYFITFSRSFQVL